MRKRKRKGKKICLHQ